MKSFHVISYLPERGSRVLFGGAIWLLGLTLIPVGWSVEPIDRQALVSRHNPQSLAFDPDAPMTVGNGGFAFGADISGLQTFERQHYEGGVPVETLARWAWASRENPEGFVLADANRDYRHADGRVVPYPTNSSSAAGMWLRENPHLQPLGQLSLRYSKQDGSALRPEDLKSPNQTLDLWRGVITSRYSLGGEMVEVMAVCHPESDTVAFRLRSALVADGRLGARLAFPRGHDMSVKNTPALDWSDPQGHRSELRADRVILRSVDDLEYTVSVGGTAALTASENDPHAFELSGEGDTLEWTLSFSPKNSPAKPFDFEETLTAATEHWRRYWSESAAIDFSGSADPRAFELERRVILSRYLMGAQMAGAVPPQESGLTCNTWYGKHHTEMIWWHAAHFALWGHEDLLASQLAWYQARLPEARRLAESRGLRGARWAKMVGPDMRESPGGNPLIVWNQPHMVALSELMYRAKPDAETLNRYQELVFATAECLASMLVFDEQTDRYVLGPPLWIAQEIYDPAASQNPSFELEYWHWTLGVAQQWRERLGLERLEEWDALREGLSKLPHKDGKYVSLESHPDTWDNVASRHDHPTMLAPLGLLPGDRVDVDMMHRTLDAVLQHWDWETKIWGWDYPMIAMTAARLGRPETAVEVLLMDGPNNAYLPTGHCPQRSDSIIVAGERTGKQRREIAAYLPANGSFLAAVAMMAAGWDGAERSLPGFPEDGSWTVRVEGLRPLP